jgi:WD40 repeat protein
VWDVAGKREWLRVPGSAGGAAAVALSPDGRCLAVGGPQDGFRVWDLEARKQKFAVAEKEGKEGAEPAEYLVFSPDGRFLLSHAPRQGSRLWQVEEGREWGSGDRDFPADATTLRYSPDGQTLAVGDGRGRITLYTRDAPPQTLRGHGGAASHLAFRGGALLSFGNDGALKEWDLSRPPAVRFRADEPPGPALTLPRGVARTIVVGTADDQADGRSLLVLARTAAGVRPPGGANSRGFAWRRFDPTSGGELPAPPFRPPDFGSDTSQGGGRVAALDIAYPAGAVMGLALSPFVKMPMWPCADQGLGGLCATAWHWGRGAATWKLAVWDAAENKVCFEAGGIDGSPMNHVTSAPRTTLSPDGRHVAAYTDALHVWEIAGRREIALPEPPPGLHAVAAAFSPDGRRVAVLIREGRASWPPELHRAPDGPSDRPAELVVLHLESGQAVWRRPIRVRWDAATTRFSFTPDGRSLVVTHNRPKETGIGLIPHFQVWSTERGPDADPLLDTLAPSTGLGPAQWAPVAFSPDGRLAALLSERDLAVWDLTTGRLRHTLQGVGRHLQGMTFGPDGTRLFVVADRETVGDRRTVTELHVFDTKSPQLLLTLPLPGVFAGAVAGMHFDGGRLIVSRVTMYGSVEFQSFDGTPASR